MRKLYHDEYIRFLKYKAELAKARDKTFVTHKYGGHAASDKQCERLAHIMVIKHKTLFDLFGNFGRTLSSKDAESYIASCESN